MENATRSTLTNVAGQAVYAVNNTTSQFAAHSSTIETAGLPVVAAFGSCQDLCWIKDRIIMERRQYRL